MTTAFSNETINQAKLDKAEKIISELQEELRERIKNQNAGPFLAAIYDEEGNLIAKESNSVVKENCSHNHAEMNTVKQAEIVLNTYDLSKYNLSIYVTAEPCIMCLGGILWSGIKNVYFGVTSKEVEEITGFDEGFKPNWLDEFKSRGITVYGNIAREKGISVLKEYVESGKTVYKPER